MKRILENYKRHFCAEGVWQITDTVLLLKAAGDVFIRDLTMDINLCILTDGDVIFEGRSQLANNAAIQARRILVPGDVEIQGYARLLGDELVIDRSLVAGKGAFANIKKLNNTGLFVVHGAGFSGIVHSLINDGKIDLESSQLKVQNFHNSDCGVLRTRGFFLFSGDKFENRGTIFTAGIHQLTLTNAYDDWGHLYVATLFLLNAPRVEFHSSYAWLQEAVINAITYLEVASASHFVLRSDQGKCFLQLSSQSDLHYHGETTQHCASFPFTAYDEIWESPTKSVFLGQQLSRAASHHLAKTPFSLASWDHLRPRDNGVVFHTDGDALDLGGSVSLIAGSVKKSVKGDLKIDGLQLRAGYFTDDNVTVSSKNAFLDNAQFQALCGRVETFVKDQAILNNTHLLGVEAAHLVSQSLTLENQALLKSVMGSALVQASGSVVVRDSGVEANTDASVITDSVDASGLWMRGGRNQLAAAQHGRVKDALLSATESTAVSMVGDADISACKFLGPKSSIVGNSLSLHNNECVGSIETQARQNLESYNTSVQGDFAVKASNVVLSGETKATNLCVDAEKTLANTGSICTLEDMVLRADDMSQLGQTQAGRDSYTQARMSYEDSEESRDYAVRKNIIDAPKTRRFNGERSAGELSYHRTAAKTTDDFNQMMNHTHAPIEEYDIYDADLHFTKDTTIGRDKLLGAKTINVHARSMTNHAHFKAAGNFFGKFDETFANSGEVNIHGQGLFAASKSLTNEGSMQGCGLSMVTEGLLTHHGHASGGDKTLHMRGKTIDAAARSRNNQSKFVGDLVDVRAEEDILADAAILRARQAAFEAGRYMKLGAVVENYSSEERRSSFFGLKKEVRRCTWQEPDVTDMAATESLSLKAGRRLTGTGAVLRAPKMHLEGSKGIALNKLRLQRTEEVEKTRAVFEVGGVDLLGSFEDEIPMPEVSVKVGARHQVTRTTQEYGVLGSISAQNLTVRTDRGAEADLSGNNLLAANMVMDTDKLRLGGTHTSQAVTDTKYKATAGVAYVGGAFVPTFSTSLSKNVDRIQSMQDAQVQIGNLHNQRAGAQIHATGVQGGINAASGESFDLTVEHPQIVQSQAGFSASVGMTRGSVSLGAGSRLGEKCATQKSHFSTPNNVHRVDILYRDSDTRMGFSANTSISFNGQQPSSLGGSLQIQNESFAIDSSMFGGPPVDPNASLFSQTLTDIGEIARQARTTAGMGANMVGVANLAGLGAGDVSGTLNNAASYFGMVERAAGSLQQMERLVKAFESQPQPPVQSDVEQDLMNELGETCLQAQLNTIEEDLQEEFDSLYDLQHMDDSEEAQGQTQLTTIEEDLQENLNFSKKEEVKPHSHPHHRRAIASRAPDSVGASEAPKISEEISPEETFLQHVIADRKAWYKRENRVWDEAAEQAVRHEVDRELGGIEQVTWHEDLLTGGSSLFYQASKGSAVAARYIINKTREFVVDTIKDETVHRLAGAAGMNQEQAQLATQLGSIALRVRHIKSSATSSKMHAGQTPPRKSSTLYSKESLSTTRPSTIQVLEKPGAIRFRDREILGVRDITHLSDDHVKRMARNGVAPYDLHGNRLDLHHINQQDHRLPGAKRAMIPQKYHRINNSRQHNLGTHEGIGDEARRHHDNDRRALFREMGRQEKEKRQPQYTKGPPF